MSTELNTEYTTPEQWEMIYQAHALLEQAGAVATIWVANDLAGHAVDSLRVDTQEQLDALIAAKWPPHHSFTDCTDEDWVKLDLIIDDYLGE